MQEENARKSMRKNVNKKSSAEKVNKTELRLGVKEPTIRSGCNNDAGKPEGIEQNEVVGENVR